jgi:bisphosphoglycerate-independent phosphoglycerate mutase (AlkP superfamily)
MFRATVKVMQDLNAHGYSDDEALGIMVNSDQENKIAEHDHYPIILKNFSTFQQLTLKLLEQHFHEYYRIQILSSDHIFELCRKYKLVTKHDALFLKKLPSLLKSLQKSKVEEDTSEILQAIEFTGIFKQIIQKLYSPSLPGLEKYHEHLSLAVS